MPNPPLVARRAFRHLARCLAMLAAAGVLAQPVAAQSVLRDAETEALLHDMASPLIAAAALARRRARGRPSAGRKRPSSTVSNSN